MSSNMDPNEASRLFARPVKPPPAAPGAGDWTAEDLLNEYRLAILHLEEAESLTETQSRLVRVSALDRQIVALMKAGAAPSSPLVPARPMKLRAEAQGLCLTAEVMEDGKWIDIGEAKHKWAAMGEIAKRIMYFEGAPLDPKGPGEPQEGGAHG